MKFIVPYDFTSISRTALDHAIQYSASIQAEIELFHVIEKQNDEREAERKFIDLIASLSDSEKAMVNYKIKVGDIFTDIGKEAEEGNAQLLIMGTHGAKGLQKLFGSHAIKVITNSSTPFIVTQSKGPEAGINRIVLPVDLTKESVQIVRFATQVAKRFDSEIHLVCHFEEDEWLANKLRNNINIVKLELNKAGIKHEVHPLQGKSSFYKEVIDYCAKYRADLIAITHFTESILPQFDKFSQEIITNQLETPVLIVNAKNISNVNTNFTFMSM